MADEWMPEGARPLDDEWVPEGARPLGTAPPASKPNVSKGETFVNSSTNALPLGKQLVDALSTGAVMAFRPKPSAHLTGQALRELAQKGIAAPDTSQPGLLKTYRDMRDTREARTEAGAEQNPLTAGAGTLIGVGLSLAAPLPKVAVGTGRTGRVLSSALTAGAYGGVNGLANGRADLSRGELGQAAEDASGYQGVKDAIGEYQAGNYKRAALDLAGAGAVGGFVTGGALSGAGELARRAAGRSMGAPLRQMAINQGRRVLTNGADSLSTRNAVSAPAVEEAIRSGAISPFGTTHGALSRLEPMVEAQGDAYGKVVAGLEAKGVEGPEATRIADKWLNDAVTKDANSLGSDVPELYMKRAEEVASKQGGSGRLKLTQAENMKRTLQEKARYGRFEETPVNEANRALASDMRQAVEDSIHGAAAKSSDAEVQRLASEFVPAKQRLGNLYEAEAAATRGAARGAQRSHFGLKETAHTAAAIASGHPGLAPAVAVGSSFLRNRVPSAVASYGMRAADYLTGSPEVTGTAGLKAATIANALREPGLAAQLNMSPAFAQQSDEQLRQEAILASLRRKQEGAP